MFMGRLLGGSLRGEISLRGVLLRGILFRNIRFRNILHDFKDIDPVLKVGDLVLKGADFAFQIFDSAGHWIKFS